MRNFPRHIIPVFVFLIVWIAGFIISIYHRNAIREMIDTAGANGEPIFVGTYPGRPKISPLCLISLDGTCIPLAMNLGYHLLVNDIEPDGTLYIYGPNQLLSRRIKYNITFPDYRARAVESYRDIQLSQAALEYANQLVNHRKQWFVEIEDDNKIVRISNLRSGIEREIKFDGKLPWISMCGPSGPVPEPYVTADGSVVFFCVFFTNNPGIAYVCRFDVESGEFTYTRGSNNLLRLTAATDQGGSTLALQELSTSGSSADLIFCDGQTGDEKFRMPFGALPVIGKSWASAMNCDPSLLNGFITYAIDMENSWELHELPLPNFNIIYSIYEPPLNGLDGMYENYVPENEQ